jgi:hypothetical protein
MCHERCWGYGGPTAGNLQLCAFRVELWVICLMLCNQLMSNEVESWCNIFWECGSSFEFFVDNSRSPVCAFERWRGHSHLVNLEPVIPTSIAGFDVCSALVKPDHNWALLVSPLLPFRSDYRATSDVCNKSSRGSSIAHNFWIGDFGSRIIVGPLSLNSRRR